MNNNDIILHHLIYLVTTILDILYALGSVLMVIDNKIRSTNNQIIEKAEDIM